MAYEQEALTVATEAFARDICDQLGKNEETIINVMDSAGDIATALVNCQSQSSVNETLVDSFGEQFDGDPEAMVVMAGAIDFFWQVYNNTAENEADE